MAARIFYVNKWQTGSCIASSSSMAFDPNSTRNPLRGIPWRSDLVSSDIWLRCDTAVAVPVTSILIASPLLSGLVGTFKLQHSSDDATWIDVPGGTITQSTGRTNLWLAYFSQVTDRYWRVLFTRTSGTGYLQIGTVYIGTYYQPTYGVNADVNLVPQDASVLTKAAYGAISRSSRPKQRKATFKFEQLPSADVLAMRNMWDATGVGVHLFFTADHENLEYTWYGYWVGDMQENNIILDEWDITIPFQEAV